ncbi:unnamed protein product [Camellia sinensis]
MLSPSHPPPRRKAPKAVDEDLYRILPELLLAKHQRIKDKTGEQIGETEGMMCD